MVVPWAVVTFLASSGTLSASDFLRETKPLKTTHPPKVFGRAEHLLWLEPLQKANGNKKIVSAILTPDVVDEYFSASPSWLNPQTNMFEQPPLCLTYREESRGK